MKTRPFHSRQPGPATRRTPENPVELPEKNAGQSGSAILHRTRQPSLPPGVRRKTVSGLRENGRQSLQSGRFSPARYRPGHLPAPVHPAPEQYPLRGCPAHRPAILHERDEFTPLERRIPESGPFKLKKTPDRKKTGDLSA